jgi:hypothetical protein
MIFIGYIETETDRALLFQDHFWTGSDWFPKSQIQIHRYEDTHEVRISASSWICGKKNIQEFRWRDIPKMDAPATNNKGDLNDIPF